MLVVAKTWVLLGGRNFIESGMVMLHCQRFWQLPAESPLGVKISTALEIDTVYTYVCTYIRK